MATIQACALVVAAAAPIPSGGLASGQSVSFGNGGLRGAAFCRARTVRALTVRAAEGESPLDKIKESVSDVAKSLQGKAESGTAAPGRKPGAGRSEQPQHVSSTGGITDAFKEAAEKTATVFDGVKEDVESKLKDDGRDLKSKTGDVVYGEKRNQQ